MKKLFTVIIAVLLVSAMSLTAFAASPIKTVGGTDGHAVNGTYDHDTGVYKTVYSVNISWNDMEFTYDGGDWNAATHTYDNTAWEYEARHNLITVANHSNEAIVAEFAFASGAGYSDISGVFYATDASTTPITSLTLAAPTAVGAGEAASAAPSASAYLKLSGTLLSDTLQAALVQVGTVTVTLNAED